MGGPCFIVVEGRKVRGPACTDNFQLRPFQFDDQSWHSVEQCYQALKYTGESRQAIHRLKPFAAESASVYGQRCWRVGQTGRNMRPEWEEVKVDVMYQVCRAKLVDNPDLQAELLATGDAQIVGAPSTWDWPKWNGWIQTKLRDELRSGAFGSPAPAPASHSSDAPTSPPRREVGGSHSPSPVQTPPKSSPPHSPPPAPTTAPPTDRDSRPFARLRKVPKPADFLAPPTPPTASPPAAPPHFSGPSSSAARSSAAPSAAASPHTAQGPEPRQSGPASLHAAPPPDASGATDLGTAEYRRVVCIGDVHGNHRELLQLWEALTRRLGEDGLARARVVFLGDYVDKGPASRAALDWLIALRAHRAAAPSSGGTHFLLGNHDLAMAAFLGCLPTAAPPPPHWLPTTLAGPEAEPGRQGQGASPTAADRGLVWPHECPEGMYYQGWRWGGGATHKSRTTFASYGVNLKLSDPSVRAQLQAAVPMEHQRFLRDLEWVHEATGLNWPGGVDKVVCVHAGLLPDVSAERQLAALRRRDLQDLDLYDARTVRANGDASLEKPAVFSGREKVMAMHADLKGSAMLVSGHHGRVEMHGDGRFICDGGAGNPSATQPLRAVVLPEGELVGHCD